MSGVWTRAGGAPLLLIVSLLALYGHLSERSDRRLALAEGRTASALLQEPSGLEYVTVSWTDEAGRERSAKAWTGKPFARQFRERRGALQRTDIKYVSDAAIAPVILSEAAERERVNAWWIYASSGMALATGLITTIVFGAYFVRRRARGTLG